MQYRDLTDNICVITGASSGIGEATARALVAEGAQVILVARSADKIEKLAAELGDKARAMPTDVGDADAVRALFERVNADYGAVDLMFNNAGVGYNDPFAESKPEEWKKQIDANLYGVLNCTHAAIPLMKGREAPMISTVSSVGGRYGVPGWSVYCATKFAVVGFHDTLRKELGGDGIRVSLIEPGAVYTNWGFNVTEDAMKERRDKVEALTAEDIANSLVYAFAQPGHVNAQEILVMPTKQVSP
ncbi:SDR family oxidoreductase [Salinisphaera hydrothermalis]|uniref:Short-chain dehydrogenase/reductase SDR n=1 Tax=Salinisphaera hydrothermalis (strain C41B8) TaxID=1304275 RepID=A0A084IKA8_SALHC|nr:SDR family oxidoreductase [Salinisphaera hydrothermalis]KEZ77142.1 short-chain dehydrogenase/reductase SDR [Salinisphaera hydrothermalis C41B8]